MGGWGWGRGENTTKQQSLPETLKWDGSVKRVLFSLSSSMKCRTCPGGPNPHRLDKCRCRRKGQSHCKFHCWHMDWSHRHPRHSHTGLHSNLQEAVQPCEYATNTFTSRSLSSQSIHMNTKTKYFLFYFPTLPCPRKWAKVIKTFICQQVKGNWCYNYATFEDGASKYFLFCFQTLPCPREWAKAIKTLSVNNWKATQLLKTLLANCMVSMKTWNYIKTTATKCITNHDLFKYKPTKHMLVFHFVDAVHVSQT